MFNQKKAMIVMLTSVLTIQPIIHSVLPERIINEVTTIANAKEIEDDDPGKERLLDGLLPPEAMGISSYVVRRMSIDGNSPFMENTPYFHSDVFAGRNVVHGIDVSKYQYNIDWPKVAADGVDYAIIRVGYRGYGASGGMGADPYFIKNIEGAILAGIDVGVYFFSQATTVEEAIEEAQYTLDKIAGYPITMPVVFDFEYASVNGKTGGRLYNAKLTKKEATAVCMAFCETIENAGYVPMVYANSVMLNNDVNASEISSKYKIWLANYTSMTSYKGTYDFWQYTSKGKVDGITGKVDCNFWYQDPKETVLGVIPSYGNASNNNQGTGNTGSNGNNQTGENTGNNGNNQTGENTGNNGNNQTGESTENNGNNQTGESTGNNENNQTGESTENNENNQTGENTGNITDVPVEEKVVEQITGITSTERTDTQLHLVWTPLTDATGYEIYRYNATTGIYQLIHVISTSAISTYMDTDLTPGTNYNYVIRAFSIEDTQEVIYGDYSERFSVATAPKMVTGFHSSSKTTTRIRLNWDWAEEVTGYEILRYNIEKKQFETVKILDSATTTWVDTKVKEGTAYDYVIKTYIEDNTGTYWSDPTEAITVKTKPAKVEDFSVTIARKDKLRLNWKQVEGADGYRIYRYNTTTKKYEKIKTIGSGDTTTWVNSKLKKNTTYKYKIKAYIQEEDGTRYTGAYGEVAKGKTKK